MSNSAQEATPIIFRTDQEREMIQKMREELGDEVRGSHEIDNIQNEIAQQLGIPQPSGGNIAQPQVTGELHKAQVNTPQGEKVGGINNLLNILIGVSVGESTGDKFLQAKQRLIEKQVGSDKNVMLE